MEESSCLLRHGNLPVSIFVPFPAGIVNSGLSSGLRASQETTRRKRGGIRFEGLASFCLTERNSDHKKQFCFHSDVAAYRSGNRCTRCRKASHTRSMTTIPNKSR